MQITVAEKENYPAICRLFTSEEELFWIFPRGKYPFTLEQLQQLAEERHALSVGIDNGQLIAFANLYDLLPGEYVFIGNVVIDPAYRGQGLGRQMLEYMLRLIYQDYGLAEARISVFSENSAALLLYSSLGFEPYRVEARLNPSNERVALIHMKRSRD